MSMFAHTVWCGLSYALLPPLLPGRSEVALSLHCPWLQRDSKWIASGAVL
jgi:hypothetical protein